MGEVLEATPGDVRAMVGSQALVPADLQRAWSLDRQPLSETAMAEILQEAPVVEAETELTDEVTAPGDRLERLFSALHEHPRTSIGTFFLSLTAITADIENLSNVSVTRVAAQVGLIGVFNAIGKKLKV